MPHRLSRLLNWCLAPRALAGISALGAAAILFGERDLDTTPFLVAVFLALWMALLAFSRRPRFALLTCWVLIAAITTISTMKLRYMGLGLHVFDLYFYQRDSEIYRFLIEGYLPVVLISAGVLVFGCLVCVFCFRRDLPIGTPRPIFAGLCVTASLTAAVADPRPAGDQLYHLSGHRTSSFFVSLADLQFLLKSPAFVDRFTAPANHAHYRGIDACSQEKPKPDIVAVLMESSVPPSLYPALKADAALNDRFRSDDGIIHRLRVETYGGGTWITTAALMTSLPALEFGWMRPYLPVFLKGRVHHSLPKLLDKCGYHTVVISPLPYPFVNEGPFMTSLGFKEYLDSKRIAAPSKHERDSFYFNAALDYIRAYRARDSRRCSCS